MSSSPKSITPYAGLRPFRTDEDYLFFGREEQTAELVSLLRQHRLLAVVGRSGSGKSSLVRAGLLPEIQGGMMQSVDSAWEISVLRPGGHPLRNLAQSLIEADLYDPEDEEVIPRLLATLNHSALGLVEACRQSDIEEGAKLLIVVDQFEELFRFEKNDAVAQDEAHAFVDLLLEASRSPEVPIYVILTMRSDYLGDCSHVPGLAEAVNRGEYLIPRLERKQLRAAIEGPAKVGGSEISYRLVQHLLNELGDEEDQLPILQHALMRTWTHWEADHAEGEAVDLRHYESTGGMGLAISNHADEIFENLPDDTHRRVAERLFRSLTEKGDDNRGVRRPTKLATLAEIGATETTTLKAVIDAYRQPGVTFLMPGEEIVLTEDTVIDLSHESLMRVWKRLRRWVSDEAQSARIYRRLVDTANLWKEGKAGLYHNPDLEISLTWRDEEKPNEAWAEQYGGGFTAASTFLDLSEEEATRAERELEAARARELRQAQELAESRARSTKLLKRFAVTVGVACLVAIGLAAWAIQQSKVAQRQTVVAQDARSEAQRLADEAVYAQGRTWLANARTLLAAKNFFGARLKAMRAVGFEGYGREQLGEAVQEAFPVLIQPDSPSGAEVRGVVSANPEGVLLWQSGSLAQHPGALNSLCLSPDRQLAASVSEAEALVRVWDAVSGEQLAPLETSLLNPEVLGFSPDGRYLALAGGSQMTFWEIDGREFTPIPQGLFDASQTQELVDVSGSLETASQEIVQPADFRSMAFSPDGQTLALGDDEGRIYVWENWSSFDDFPELPTRENVHSGRIVDLEFQPGSGALLASASRGDGFVQLLDGKSFKLLDALENPAVPTAVEADGSSSEDDRKPVLRSIAFSADGRLLAVGGSHLPVTVWDVADRQAVATPLAEQWRSLNPPSQEEKDEGELGFSCSSVAFSATGTRLAVAWNQLGAARDPAKYRPGLTFFDLVEGDAEPRGIRHLSVAANFGTHCHFASDDDHLLLGLNFGNINQSGIRLWDLVGGGDVIGAAEAHSMAISSLCFSPDGTRFASADRFGSIRIWDARSGEVTASIQAHIGSTQEICFSADGRRLFSIGHRDKKLAAWDPDTGENLGSSRELDQPLVSLKLTPEGDSLIVGSYSSDYHCFDPESLEPQRIVSADSGNRLLFSPDGKHAAICHNNGQGEPDLTVYSADPDGELGDITLQLDAPMHPASLRNLVFSPDGQTLAMSFEDGVVRTWKCSATGWNESIHLTMPDGIGGAWVEFTPSGDRMITSDNGGLARIWTRDGEATTALPAPDPLTTLAISPDGSLLVTGSRHGILQLWSIPRDSGIRFQTNKIGAEGTGDFWRNGALSVAVARSRRLVFTANHRDSDRPNAIKAWEIQAGRLVPSFLLEGHTTVPPVIVVSPDERYLASSALQEDGEGIILLWDLETRKSQILAEPEFMSKVAFTPDSKTLATRLFSPDGERPGPIQFWDLGAGGALVAESATFTHPLFGLEFTPDGKKLILTEFIHGRPIRVFDFDPETRSMELAHTFPGINGRLTKLAVSPDGSFFMSASTRGQNNMLWNLPDFSPRGPAPMIELGNWAFSAAISPDGKLVAVGGGRSKVVIARTDGSGEIVRQFQGPAQGVFNFAVDLDFDSDNRTLFVSFNDGTVISYRVPDTGGSIDASRYLDVLDLEEASGQLAWKVRSDRLLPHSGLRAFNRIGDRYLSILDGKPSAAAARQALFQYYLDEHQFHAANAVALTVAPEDAPPIWERLSSSIADYLVSAKLDDRATGHLWLLAREIFEDYPPGIETQLKLLVENSDWDGIASTMRERIPELDPELGNEIVEHTLEGLDDYAGRLLGRTGDLTSDEALLPSRELLMAAALHETAKAFMKVSQADPWAVADVFSNTPMAAVDLLERLEQEERVTLMPAGSEWKYFGGAGAPGGSWKEVSYDDNAWRLARGPLGYSTRNNDQTDYGAGGMIAVPRTKDTQQLTYYFRKELEIPVGLESPLYLTFLCDDGLALYLNGEEILRHNLPGGEITHETTASATVGEDKTVWNRAQTVTLTLGPGTHQLAAEIHQRNTDSSDILFDLALATPAEDRWRSAENLRATAGFLSNLTPESPKPWLWLIKDPTDTGATVLDGAGIHSSLAAWMLAETGGFADAIAIADRRIAALEGKFAPLEVGERKRWLKWKSGWLRESGHPESEVEEILKTYRAIPPRPPGLDPKLIDLTDFYVRSFYYPDNETAIPETYGGSDDISYDVRGVIELNSGLLDTGKTVSEVRANRDGYQTPDKVEGITIGQQASTVHFLLNTFWGRETEPVEVGKFVFHYEDGTSAERPIISLEDVADWYTSENNLQLPPEKVAWRNPRPKPNCFLAELSWENPYPEKTITTIDFISSLRRAAPFLVAITLE